MQLRLTPYIKVQNVPENMPTGQIYDKYMRYNEFIFLAMCPFFRHERLVLLGNNQVKYCFHTIHLMLIN